MSEYQDLTGDDLVRAFADDFFSSIRILRQQLNGLERLIMIDLDQVLTEVQSQSAMISDLSAAVVSLSQHVTDHENGTVIAPVVQSKIDALMTGAVANKVALADAIKLAISAIQTIEVLKSKPNNLA